MGFYADEEHPPAELEVLAAVIGTTIDGMWVATNWLSLDEDIKDSMRAAALGVYESEWMRQHERTTIANYLRKIGETSSTLRIALTRLAEELEAQNDPASLIV